MQTQLPGSTLVVPEDGVIRRWEVRSARGELSLAVLRLGSSHSGGALQVARSQNEFVENCGVYTFPTDLAVERGDRIGIVLIGGSGIGVRHGVSGTTTERWVPRLQGAAPSRVFRAGTGFDDELLLRVEYVSGVQQRIPNQVTGAQASALPPGRVVRRSGILRLKDGRHVQVAVVAVAGRLVLDEFVDGHRTARSEVPAFRPPGRIITYQVNVDDTGEGLQIYIEYAREDSTRILDHFYAADATKFEFVN